jgi:hypothetical protein
MPAHGSSSISRNSLPFTQQPHPRLRLTCVFAPWPRTNYWVLPVLICTKNQETPPHWVWNGEIWFYWLVTYHLFSFCTKQQLNILLGNHLSPIVCDLEGTVSQGDQGGHVLRVQPTNVAVHGLWLKQSNVRREKNIVPCLCLDRIVK